MEVKLERKNQAFHYEAQAGEHTIHIDGNPAIGGEGKGARPMELMLTGIGGCVSIDLGLILKKQRQQLDDYSITVSGKRKEDGAKEFTAVHLEFVLKGDLDEQKVKRAVELTINKYCSAIQSLDKNIEITRVITIE